MPARFVAAIDQGTTSTRCLLIDADGAVRGSAQREHRQYFPRPGWVEHDPEEIWAATVGVLGEVCRELAPGDVAAVGITNQRETTIVWDRTTGAAVHPAIVWQDTRTDGLCRDLAEQGGVDRYRARTGLPLATYFAGPKIAWILDNVPGARDRAERGELAAGTVDSYLVWRLTGGPDGGRHLTDVTNASRTLLMDLATSAWDRQICAEMRVPLAVLPEIVPSSHVVGAVTPWHGASCPGGEGMTLPAPLHGVPIAGILGDQQAATVGQACLAPGDVKNTYGTGNFLLMNTGTEPILSEHGLLTTVAYQFGSEPVTYALEGSIAVTGSLVQWLRDGLGIIDSAAEIEPLAASVPDTGGAYLVPAFSGLFAPYWRPDARGAIVGLTRFVTKAHLARAALEAVAFQTRDVVLAMQADAERMGVRGAGLAALKVDGGMVADDLLMQIQADLLGSAVIRPVVTETTALGAAYAAGLAAGFWPGKDAIRRQWRADKRWEPALAADEREARYARWRMAVTRTYDWA